MSAVAKAPAPPAPSAPGARCARAASTRTRPAARTARRRRRGRRCGGSPTRRRGWPASDRGSAPLGSPAPPATTTRAATWYRYRYCAWNMCRRASRGIGITHMCLHSKLHFIRKHGSVVARFALHVNIAPPTHTRFHQRTTRTMHALRTHYARTHYTQGGVWHPPGMAFPSQRDIYICVNDGCPDKGAGRQSVAPFL